ncbi:MAG: hypothetical protein IJN25_10090, partial [Clostridia bacterium]|nr:hypothetical protein [Clostridia bacterium]
NFLCLIEEFTVFKLFDQKRRKIYNTFDAEAAAGLTPCKADKSKGLKFSKVMAYCVRVLLH